MSDTNGGQGDRSAELEELPDVERRLRDLYAAPGAFDGPSVQAGAMHRAGQIRRRRNLLAVGGSVVGVAALVAALAAGPQLFRVEGQDLVAASRTSTSQGPAPVTVTVTTTVAPPVSASKTAPTPSTRASNPPPQSTGQVANPSLPGAYPIPDIEPRGDELVGGVRFRDDLGNYPKQPTAAGAQQCNLGRGGREPVAGRQWAWWADGGDGVTVNHATLTVTGWAQGTADEALLELGNDSGDCIWLQPPTRLTWAGHDEATAWLSTGQDGARTVVTASVRLGDVLVTVVGSARDATVARQIATGMADAAVARLRASGLPAAQG